MAGSWREIAAVRARDVRMRIAFSILIALAGAILTHKRWPGEWLAATTLAQFLSLAITEPMRRAPGFRVSAGREKAFLASLGLSAGVFAACGPLFWIEGGSDGKLIALFVLAGGAINVGMQARSSARLMWIGCTPFVILLQALPLMSLLSATGEERKVMGVTAFAATLFVLHLVASGRRSVQGANRIEQALDDADRERRRAQAASAAKSDFLGVMSHELRTPLNGVLGMAQVMEGDELAPRQRARLDVIRQSGEILLVLLNDILDISRIDSAKVELAEQAVDLQTLAVQTEAVFRPLAEAKRLGFELRLLDSAGAARLGDPLRVRQVLHHLIGNAIKFTDAGSVSAVIGGDGGVLVFEVADTGPGVAAERLDIMFERFSQSDPSATRRHGGSGVGLAVARGLAQMMGGDVTARSAPGEGSIFTARLVLPETGPVPAPNPYAMQEASERRLRVLAAEDNPTNQLVLQTLLEQVGLTVHIVADGQEAIEAWRNAFWDVVLMDIRMPVMDGFAATRAIRAIEASQGLPRTPIVAVTADAMPHQASEYKEAGMDGLVPKPLRLEQLVTAIIEAVDAAEGAQEAARAGAAQSAA